jgi:hypothetical protein
MPRSPTVSPDHPAVAQRWQLEVARVEGSGVPTARRDAAAAMNMAAAVWIFEPQAR